MSKLSSVWNWIKYGNPSYKGYTFNFKDFTPVTEEDYESVTVDFPNVVGIRRRWLDHKPDRKVVGYR
jgi:hypothetical protein